VASSNPDRLGCRRWNSAPLAPFVSCTKLVAAITRELTGGVRAAPKWGLFERMTGGGSTIPSVLLDCKKSPTEWMVNAFAEGSSSCYIDDKAPAIASI
jgi:hypothetical protein